VAISFAPLEAMLMGCPVIAPRNLDWPLFYDDRVNILLYEEGNYHSCKEVVDYFRSSEQIQLNLSRRGREAVLAMNSAELFTERWTSVLDAALASAVRGVGRLKTDANAPLSKTTLLRRSEKERAYELVTSLEMAGKDVVIGHPAKAWLNPRQLLRKYKSLRAYSPVRYDLMRKHCATKKTAVIVGDDFGLYSLCAAVLGSRVLSFNYHRWSCSELAFTAALNAVGGVPVDLSPLEYRLVAYLMLRRGRVVSLQELVENVHGDEEQRSNAIEVLVGRVRRKLGSHWIETRRGFGYMIPEQPA